MRIDMTKYGLESIAGSDGATDSANADATLAVARALADLPETEEAVLVFPKGTYSFRSEFAAECTDPITNHDQINPARRAAFFIERREGLIIDGQGSSFVFHGPMIPFALKNSAKVTLRGFSIDWERPMFEQGIVTASDNDGFDIRLPDGVEYEMRDGGLYFRFGDGMHRVWGFHDIDPMTRAHAYASGDRISWSSFQRLRLAEVAPKLIRVTGDIRHFPITGHIVTMRIGLRENPGIFINGCKDVLVEDVAVFHAPGMGLVAQHCDDITLRRFDVKLRDGSGRIVTATADATHFTSCRGELRLEDCLFENQLDDPCNVHGVYLRVATRLDDRTLLLKFMHEMTIGLAFAEPGDKLQLVNGESLLPYSELTVSTVRALNHEYLILQVEGTLPSAEEIGSNAVVENVSAAPNLTVARCTVRANRARGFLITTPGKVLLEDNTISAPGAGVKISGDANSWYESGAVRDVTIRGNRFLDCNYCYPDWGSAVIDIDPEIADPERYESRYHGNIAIVGNTFETFGSAIVQGHGIDGFRFEGNTIRRNRETGYPRHEDDAARYAVELEATSNAFIANNSIEDGDKSATRNTLASINGKEQEIT